ncbi:MAG: flagellin [Eubacterium sp.]|nr:flagellin [Eubacterium sp.]
MVVQHNLTAMNSNRQLGVITGSQAKSAEKLSSGYRINRAADDAAGLKISEKMRSQVRGLTRASDNAQDGVSLIQTAEGALNEAHSILQRMNELAVQGANDTNENIDRNAINQELDALTAELDRISQTTQFNKQNLLDGSFKSKNLQVGANSNQNIAISIDKMDAAALGLRSIAGVEGESTTQTGVKIESVKFNGETFAAISANQVVSSIQAEAISAFKLTISANADSVGYQKQLGEAGSIYYLTTSGATCSAASWAMANDVSLAKDLVSATLGDITEFGKYLATDKVTGTKDTVATGEAFSLNVPTVDSYAKANATINAVQSAINAVSSQRSALGALQNRLEHTIANLDNVAENTQAAESRIRDTDMADEMVEYSKNNILAQAGQSMLAQANQSTQGVLSLLG